MMNWVKVSLVALMVSALAIPAMAQEDTESARKVTLKEAFKAGTSVTEKVEEATNSDLTLADNPFQQQSRVETKTKVTEVLAVGEDGKITKARMRWTEGTTVTETIQMGNAADPVEEDGELNGTSILYTWDAEKKAWESKLEEGDSDSDEVKKQLKKTKPFVNPFMPDREVTIGESWDASEEDLKAMIGDDDAVKLSSIAATCKAEEIVSKKDGDYLKVAVEITMKGELQDESLGKPDMEATQTGFYLYHIEEARIVSIELEIELAFEGEVDGQAGKMAMAFELEGTETRALSYAKTEEEDKEGKKEDEGK